MMSNARRAPVVITLATAMLLFALVAAILSESTPGTDSTAQAAVADQFERQFGFRMEIAPGPPSERVLRAFQGGGFKVITPETTQ